MDFKRFSFDETKHLNKYIDYELWQTKKTRSQKLFIEANNPLSMFKDVINDGYIKIEDSTDYIYKTEIKDYNGNTTLLTIPIYGQLKTDASIDLKDTESKYLVRESETTVLEGDFSSVTIYPKSVYEDILIDFKSSGDTVFNPQKHYSFAKKLYH